MTVLQAVRSYLESLSPVPAAELEPFLAALVVKEYAPGEFFTRIGDTHDRVGFVVRGVFRVYYLGPEGELHVRNFCKEGMPLGSYATILTGQPAHVSIEALETSVVAQFPYRELSTRFARHPTWERLGRRVAEEHYIARERREYTLLALDAQARYERFREDFPGLESRVTQTNIASYVGVKPETLSRLKKNAAS